MNPSQKPKQVGARPHQKMQSENAEEGVHLCQGEQEEEK